MTGTFEIREHTADVAVAARGDTIDDVFGAMADGLAATMCDEWPADGDRFKVHAEAANKDALLFDYLDELIYQRDVLDVLPVDNAVTVACDDGRWQVEGHARGVPTSLISAREIKAVTYSEMILEERGDHWYAYVVFDV